MKTALFSFLFFCSCMANQPNVDLAIQTADHMHQIFQHTVAGNEAIVRASHPPQETLTAYLAAAKADTDAYDRELAAHIGHLLSFGILDAATINVLSDTTVALIRAAKGK